MKRNHPVRKTEPKVRMGSGDAPAKVTKHISKTAASETASPRDTGRPPMVRIGGGEVATRIIKHSR
jgi:hypothetical protein